jgi:hypothetical protein
VGNGDHDQGDEEPGAVASSTDDATGRDAGMLAFRPVRSAEALPVVESDSASQGLAIAASLAMSRTGVLRTPGGPRRNSPLDRSYVSWMWLIPLATRGISVCEAAGF